MNGLSIGILEYTETMKVITVRTPIVRVNDDLWTVMKTSLPQLAEQSVVVVSSKIIALCEGAVAPLEGTDKEALIQQEADAYMDPIQSKYGHHFTIKQGTLIGSAGIDESNADGHYVLWPRNPQESANNLRAWLQNTYGLSHLGVLIVDSTSYPLRRGALGVAIAHSGFKAVHSYVGQQDLFGREMQLETANVAGGLAAAAVLAMGEGSEGTPIALMSDVPFVEFVDEDPTETELRATYLPLEDDLFAPFWERAPWELLE